MLILSKKHVGFFGSIIARLVVRECASRTISCLSQVPVVPVVGDGRLALQPITNTSCYYSLSFVLNIYVDNASLDLICNIFLKFSGANDVSVYSLPQGTLERRLELEAESRRLEKSRFLVTTKSRFSA